MWIRVLEILWALELLLLLAHWCQVLGDRCFFVWFSISYAWQHGWCLWNVLQCDQLLKCWGFWVLIWVLLVWSLCLPFVCQSLGFQSVSLGQFVQLWTRLGFSWLDPLTVLVSIWTKSWQGIHAFWLQWYICCFRVHDCLLGGLNRRCNMGCHKLFEVWQVSLEGYFLVWNSIWKLSLWWRLAFVHCVEVSHERLSDCF